MIFAKSLYVSTTAGVDLIHIGHEVRGFLREAKVDKGWVNVMVPRPGGGVLVLEMAEKKSVQLTADQARLLPKTLVIGVEKGQMVIDPWQEIYLADYDNVAKRREVIVQIWGEEPPKGPPGMPAGM